MRTAGRAICPLRSGSTCSITSARRAEVERRKDARQAPASSQRCTPNRASSADRGGGGGGGGFCAAAAPERGGGGRRGFGAPGGGPVFKGGGSGGGRSVC